MEIFSFILLSVAIIVFPGPNILVIISTSVSHGRFQGIQTVVGTSTAMIIQLIIAALGTSWFVSALSRGFYWLKWAGVIYLVYLGLNHLFRIFAQNTTKTVSAIDSFQRGFWVSLTNPKTILFFSAFLPQFATSSESYLHQIAILSVLFWVLAVVLDSGYALLASKLAPVLQSNNRWKLQNGCSGLLYLGAGMILATTREE